jgi:hypothetical protein
VNVPLYHHELDTTIYVAESAVPIHQASGWVRADGEPAAGEESAPDTHHQDSEPEAKPATSTARRTRGQDKE